MAWKDQSIYFSEFSIDSDRALDIYSISVMMQCKEKFAISISIGISISISISISIRHLTSTISIVLVLVLGRKNYPKSYKPIVQWSTQF